MDHSIPGPVIHICHTAEAPPIRVPVDNYEFTLKAYSSESTSESVTLRFEQLFEGFSLVSTGVAPD